MTTHGVEEESNDLSFMDNLAHDDDDDDDDENDGNCYCDPARNTACNSTDCSLLSGHEEVSQSALHRAFGEAAARGAKNSTGFYPINEETVFMDPPSDLMNVQTVVQAPPYDNWIGSSSYSSATSHTNSTSDSSNTSSNNDNSSSSNDDDEYCCRGQLTITNSEDTSSDLDIGTKCSLKRTRPSIHRGLRLYENEEGVVHHANDEVKCVASVSKRLRVKNDKQSGDSQDDNLVDVRMIDFAHTTFGHPSNSNVLANPSTIHQGPDCGFLTGLDSLKRLLMEILAEG